MSQQTAPVRALLPRGDGHQFVVYGDSCSGVPNALHERTFAAVNAVVARLDPPPAFILFPGDEIIGLTPDEAALRAQWRHWRDNEMAWLKIPIWHATANHTTYDSMSEAVFRDVLNMPRNGPPGQEGLSYWVRRGDLLLVAVHTLWTGLGGEGHVETEWLERTLSEHADARWKLVMGHHPVFPVNGYAGAYARQVGPEHAAAFWDILVRHKVLAYVCSHILAFDVQARRGVLQLLTAGAGTAHRMPEQAEYLHCVQAALDAGGLRYQVLDTAGQVRERLSWPPALPSDWRTLPAGESEAPVAGPCERVIAMRMTGRAATAGFAAPQTLIAAFTPGVLAQAWIGLRGHDQRLTVTLAPHAGRSPHYWLGASVAPGQDFDIWLLIHPDMGPGGLMRQGPDGWTSLEGTSAWGAEQLDWPPRWTIGHAQAGPADRPFAGSGLVVSFAIAQKEPGP